METSIEKFSPLTRNLLCVLEQLSMLRIKKDSHKFDFLKKEFELISRENSGIKCYCSVDWINNSLIGLCETKI